MLCQVVECTRGADEHSVPNCQCFGLTGYSKDPETLFRHVAGGINILAPELFF